MKIACKLYSAWLLSRARGMLYSIHKPRKRQLFVTVGWGKQRGGRAEPRLWDGWMQRQRQISEPQREEDGYKNVTCKGRKPKKKKRWREEKEGHTDRLYPIYPTAVWMAPKCLRVMLGHRSVAHTRMGIVDFTTGWKVHLDLQLRMKWKHLKFSEVSYTHINIHFSIAPEVFAGRPSQRE